MAKNLLMMEHLAMKELENKNMISQEECHEKHKNLDEKIEQIRTTCLDIDKAIRGSSDQKNEGIILRLDRIEQREANRNKILMAVTLAVIVALVNSLFGVLNLRGMFEKKGEVVNVQMVQPK